MVGQGRDDCQNGYEGPDWSATVPVAALYVLRAVASEDACAPVTTLPIVTSSSNEYETCRVQKPPTSPEFSKTRLFPQSTLR